MFFSASVWLLNFSGSGSRSSAFFVDFLIACNFPVLLFEIVLLKILSGLILLRFGAIMVQNGQPSLMIMHPGKLTIVL